MLSNKTRSIQMTEFNVSYFNNGSILCIHQCYPMGLVFMNQDRSSSWIIIIMDGHGLSLSCFNIIMDHYHHGLSSSADHHRSLSLWNYDHGSSSLWIIIIINHHWPWIMIIITFDHHHRVLQWKSLVMEIMFLWPWVIYFSIIFHGRSFLSVTWIHCCQFQLFSMEIPRVNGQ